MSIYNYYKILQNFTINYCLICAKACQFLWINNVGIKICFLFIIIYNYVDQKPIKNKLLDIRGVQKGGVFT